MNTYYYDTDTGLNKRDWKKLTGSPTQKLDWDPWDEKFKPAPIDGVVFIHDSSLNFTKSRAQGLSSKHPSAILIWISGGPLTGEGKRFYAVKRPVSGPIDPEFSSRVQRFLSVLEINANPRFELLDSDQEELLAFRLLCEAKLICGSAASKEMHGITIHAPKNLDDWLFPFKYAEETPTIETVAVKLGESDVQAKAVDLLNMVRDCAYPDDSISEFLEISKEI